MNSGSAFFQILYQNDTLYQLAEFPPKPEEQETKSSDNITAVNQASNETKESADTVNPSPAEILDAPAAPQENFPNLWHKVLILIDEPKQKAMPETESTFLNNILKAVKHSTDQADIINFSFLNATNANQVLAEKKTNYFITFGVPLIKLQLDLLLIPYTPKMVEGIWFLLTDPLVVIEADRDLKKKLWQALQKMFEMSI